MKTDLKKFEVITQGGATDYVTAHRFESTTRKHGLLLEFYVEDDLIALIHNARSVRESELPVPQVEVLQEKTRQLTRLVDSSIRAFRNLAEESNPEHVPFGGRRSRLLIIHQRAKSSSEELAEYLKKVTDVLQEPAAEKK